MPGGQERSKTYNLQLTTAPKLLKIRIPSSASPDLFQKLKPLFSANPGPVAVSLVIPDREGTAREVKTNFTVNNTLEFKTELRILLKNSMKQ